LTLLIASLHTDPTNVRPELSGGNISICDNCCTTKSPIRQSR
jgi:hypothetical protein